MKSRVVIIGGGLIGSLTALRLADAGAEVIVLERAVPGAEASSAAAGILSAQCEARTPDPFFELAVESRALHARLAIELRERTGLDIGWRHVGAIELARTDEELEDFGEKVSWQSARGLSVERLGRKELYEREPRLARDFAGGWRFADDAVVDPPRLVSAVSQAAALAGVEFRTGVTVKNISVVSGRTTGVETDQGTLGGDTVVVCAGAWSGQVTGALTHSTDVRPARGQVIEIATRPVPIGTVLYGPGGYMVPRADGHVYVGSTLEFVGFNRGVTVSGMGKLVSLATVLVPSLGEATVTRSWSNFRPYTADGVPLVGPAAADGPTGLFLATGHYRSGILMAPITAMIVSDLIAHDRRHPALGALSPSRPLTSQS